MIIVTVGFSKKSFFINITYFLETLSNDLELVFLELKHIYKTQRPSLFSFYSYKNAVLKNLAIFMGKQCGIFRNTYFEEHLPMATSQMTLRSACLKLCFWIAFKTISTHKNTNHFQTKLYTKFGGYGIYIFNPYAFLRT